MQIDKYLFTMLQLLDCLATTVINLVAQTNLIVNKTISSKMCIIQWL